MTETIVGLANVVPGDTAAEWQAGRERLTNFLHSVGLTGGEHSQSLHIFPQLVANPEAYVTELRTKVDDGDPWMFITGSIGSAREPMVIAFPVKNGSRPNNSRIANKRILSALFVEVHSKLVSWWLVNAWRARQLAAATWQLGDSMQIIAAASCARSLLETAASFWVDSIALRALWDETKSNHLKGRADIECWQTLTKQLYRMVWGAKFDSNAPQLLKSYGKIPRTNILTQIEKLARASSVPVHELYQWLCNAVHPSVGGMLSFASPILRHDTNTCAYQYVCEVPTFIQRIPEGNVLRDTLPNVESTHESSISREETIQVAIARASVFAVEVLERTLDDALKIVDDVGLTTKAPTMANFGYWRNFYPRSDGSRCPCRSGKKVKQCFHRWTDRSPMVHEQF